MRQTLIVAAIAVAFNIGVRQNAWKLTNKLDCDELELKEEFTQYIMPSVEMFEVAQEMAMETPPNAQNIFYNDFGNWFASECRENGKFPEREQAMANLAETIVRVFTDALSRTQRDALAKRLKDFK